MWKSACPRFRSTPILRHSAPRLDSGGTLPASGLRLSETHAARSHHFPGAWPGSKRIVCRQGAVSTVYRGGRPPAATFVWCTASSVARWETCLSTDCGRVCGQWLDEAPPAGTSVATAYAQATPVSAVRPHAALSDRTAATGPIG